ncbi:hypothetical protein OAO87_02045 [bacterium]|nr:hypothetical protein [bacterium]
MFGGNATQWELQLSAKWQLGYTFQASATLQLDWHPFGLSWMRIPEIELSLQMTDGNLERLSLVGQADFICSAAAVDLTSLRAEMAFVIVDDGFLPVFQPLDTPPLSEFGSMANCILSEYGGGIAPDAMEYLHSTLAALQPPNEAASRRTLSAAGSGLEWYLGDLAGLGAKIPAAVLPTEVTSAMGMALYVQQTGMSSDTLVSTLTAYLSEDSTFAAAAKSTTLDVAFAAPFPMSDFANFTFTPAFVARLHLPDLIIWAGFVELRENGLVASYTPSSGWKLEVGMRGSGSRLVLAVSLWLGSCSELMRVGA